MRHRFRIQAYASTACIEPDPPVFRTRPQQIDTTWLPSENAVRRSYRITWQPERPSKIVAAARWQHTQQHIAAIRCVYQSLESSVSSHGQQKPVSGSDRLHCSRLQIFGALCDHKLNLDLARLKYLPDAHQIAARSSRSGERIRKNYGGKFIRSFRRIGHASRHPAQRKPSLSTRTQSLERIADLTLATCSAASPLPSGRRLTPPLLRVSDRREIFAYRIFRKFSGDNT